jgi:glutamate-1-semialdehyde 2,1-aminomutase
MYRQGERLAVGVRAAIRRHGLDGYVEVLGRSCNLVYATRDVERQPSQPFRTLFMNELIRHGILAPSFVVSAAHSDADIDATIAAVDAALVVYRRALDHGISTQLNGRPVKPVMRTLN